MPRHFPIFSHGGVLIFTLVMFGMFMVVMLASVGLVSRQFNRLVIEEQEEQAFQSAEAGINYALWLLSNDLVSLDDPQPIEDYEIVDDTVEPAEVIGTFDLTFEVATPDDADFPMTTSVTSTGQDPVLIGQQAVITASIYSPDGDIYVITNWNRKP